MSANDENLKMRKDTFTNEAMMSPSNYANVETHQPSSNANEAINTQEPCSSNTLAKETPHQTTGLSDDVRSVLSENLQLRESLKSTITSLDDRNLTVEEEVINLKQENNSLWANSKRETDKLEEVKSDIQKLQDEYKIELVKREEVSTKNESIKGVIDEMKNYVRQIVMQTEEGEVKAINNAKRKMDILQQFDQLNQQFDPLCNYLMQERQKLVAELKLQNEVSLIEADENLSKLKDGIASKKAELEELKLEFQTIKTNIVQTSRKVTEGKTNCQSKEAKISEIKNEIIVVEKANTETIRELEKKIVEKRKSIAALHEQIAGKENSINLLNSEMENLSKKVENVENANKEASERIIPLKQKISSLTETEENLRLSIESLKERIMPLSGVETENKELLERISTMENDLQTLSAEIEAENSKLNCLQERKSELISVLDVLTNENEEGAKELQRISEEQEEYAILISNTEEKQRSETTKLRETIDSTMESIKEHEKQITEETALNEQLDKEINELETINEDYKEKIRARENELQCLKEKASSLQETILEKENIHKTELDKKAKEIDEISTKIDSMSHLPEKLEGLEKKLNDLLEKKNSEMVLFNEEMARKKLSLENELKKDSEECEALQRNYESVEKDLLEKNENILKEMNESKTRIDAITKEKETLEEKLNYYKNLKTKLETQCALYEDKMKKVKQDLNVTKQDLYNVIYKKK